MSTDKIQPFHDPRVTLRSALINGFTYGYLHSLPQPPTSKRDTIVLIHGFPDISFGWRYQIPLLTSLGLEVIAIDCMGYGRTDSPPSSNLSAYTFKRVADDVATLCSQLGHSRIILGGHDWGGAIVYRIQQYYPSLIKAFFAICTPYFAPNPTYQPLQQAVATNLPNFRYQIHLSSGEIETHVQSPSEIRQLLHALYGGRTASREVGFIAEQGVVLSNLPEIQPNKHLSSEEMDYYVAEYARHGMNGPLNWYRTRELNWADDFDFFFDGGKKLPEKKSEVRVVGCEVLFVQAEKDQALRPFMARKMTDHIERLTWKKVDAGHWCLWEKSDECNAIIKDWLEEKVFVEADKSRNNKL